MGEILTSAPLQGAAELIDELGGSAAKVAVAAGIPFAALSDLNTPVLGYAMTDFYELAAEQCRCRNFGLRMAERSSLAVVGPVWDLLSTAETIGQMVEDLVTNFAVYSEAALINLERMADGVLMSFEGRAGHTESEVQMMEYALAITCNELRRHCPLGWEPPTVQFRHAAPPERKAHLRTFGPNLMFEQDRNAIFMDEVTLRQQRHRAPTSPRLQAQKNLDQLDQKLNHNISIRVEAAIRSAGHLSDCSLVNVSNYLGISERTLQRRLAAEATDFTSILEMVRSDLALKYIRQSRLPFSQVAELLGYSELSAFSRAFRRWYGRSAKVMRRINS